MFGEVCRIVYLCGIVCLKFCHMFLKLKFWLLGLFEWFKLLVIFVKRFIVFKLFRLVILLLRGISVVFDWVNRFRFCVLRLFGYFIVETTGDIRRATIGSSGYDLRAKIDNPVYLQAGVPTLIPTGVRLNIPIGYEAQVRSRSGLALKHGVIVLNSPGTIDSDYRGEVGVILFSTKEQVVEIQPNAVIAQLVFARVEYPSLFKVKKIDIDTDRGEGGFGSTDTKVNLEG